MYRLGAKAPSEERRAPPRQVKRRPISEPAAFAIPESWRFAGLFVAISLISYVVLLSLESWLHP